MGAVAYRLRSVVRSRWLATLTVAFVVALVSGVVIALGAGARRTATAPDRYSTEFNSTFDALVTQQTGGAPRTAEVAALPGVASVKPLTFVFGGLRAADGTGIRDGLVFAGTYQAAGVRLVAGRDARADDPREFVATQSFVDQNHARIGDSFELVTLTQEEADTNGFAVSEPHGPSLRVVLVGVVQGPSQLDDPTPTSVVSGALLDVGDVGVSLTLLSVDLRPGVDLTDLRHQLDTLPDHQTLSSEPAPVISGPVRHAVETQARGLWLLTTAAAIAALAVLGQLITRHVRPTPAERARLTAVGFTDHQVLAGAVANAAIPIILGALLGIATAVVPSDVFPTGFARALEPHPGLRFDGLVVLLGAGLSIVALTAWTFVALTLDRTARRPVRPSAVVEGVATRLSSATAGTGVRLAFTRRGGERGSVRSAIIGVALSVAAVTAAVTFGASLERLLQQPFRYGSNYDLRIGDNGAAGLPPGLTDRLAADPHVTSLVVYTGSFARVGDASVPLLGLQAMKGDALPTELEGRLPVSRDEIAFGRVTGRRLGVGIGDAVTVGGATGTKSFRVTGLAVLPGLGANDGLGSGGLVTPDGLAAVDSTAQPTSVAVQLDVAVTEFAAGVPELADTPPETPFEPPDIVNVGRIRQIPFVLAAVLGALAALTVGHVMLTSMRGGRRDFAILRSLGATRGWVTRTVHWQATGLTFVPVALGLPAGVVAGRLIFTAYADDIGAVDDAAIPFATLALVVAAIIALANAVAVGPARRARRIEPALLLRSE